MDRALDNIAVPLNILKLDGRHLFFVNKNAQVSKQPDKNYKNKYLKQKYSKT